MEITLDKWQQEILDYEGHIGLAKGRRIGATHLFAIKAVKHLMKHENHHPKSQIVCMSLTEDQAQLIIAFATNYADKYYKQYIGKGADKPTLNKLTLVVKGNKRIMLARPVGASGNSARGFEGQVLMIDEAAYHPELLWDSATPLLLTTGGQIWMWSTFEGRENYFYKKYEEAVEKKLPDARFKFWVKETEEVIRERPISESWTEKQREEALRFLEEEKRDKSAIAYAQEYCAKAADSMKQFFSDEWINKVCVRLPDEKHEGFTFMGNDLARLGGDQFTAEVLSYAGTGKAYQVDHYARALLLTTENERLIKEFTMKWNCYRVGIDAGAGTLGVSVLDHLLEDKFMAKKVKAMNNRQIIIDDRDENKQRLFKVDMYDNLRAMGERGEIELWNHEEVKASLRSISITFKTDANGITHAHISGRFSHIAEGIIRAAMLIKKEKINKLQLHWI